AETLAQALLDDLRILCCEPAQKHEPAAFRDQPAHRGSEVLGGDGWDIGGVPGDSHGNHSFGADRQLGRRGLAPNAVQGEPLSTMISRGRRSTRTKSTPWPTSSRPLFMSSEQTNRYLRPSSARMTPVPISGRNLVICPYMILSTVLFCRARCGALLD